jgi:[ribosomal protein S18]-alanine N-acetyltransferase
LQNPWFFGIESGSLKGFVLARQMLDELELFLIAVHPFEQSKGCGKSLLRELLHLAKAKGIRQIFLEVRELNQVAIALYESFGFVKITTRKKYYKNGENAWVMRLTVCN